MSERVRTSTDESSPASPSSFESFEQAVTDVTARPGALADEHAAEAAVDPLADLEPTPVDHEAPVEPMRGAARSEPVRVISMKDHPELQRPRPEPLPVPLHVQLRSIADVARGRRDTPVGLGHLAPPRDPREARARRLRDNVVWACVAIVLACAIMLAIWFLAGA